MTDTHEDSFPQETNRKTLIELKLQRKEISNFLKRNKLFRNSCCFDIDHGYNCFNNDNNRNCIN